ncbi:S8 family peptidase [Streptomyces cylindrosporus]|uniref:S8 family serine peptidase n=1 Tax=Streptomyces cylindrosporus TaxID=2927583 RepID=A0ABS9YCI1_9ACTN|nr:S8 family serine peptidase [Streptomyces cylindrosporus]MCI3274929.1 S8 family serine peptidase [Streptomyces cylindrosporus]
MKPTRKHRRQLTGGAVAAALLVTAAATGGTAQAAPKPRAASRTTNNTPAPTGTSRTVTLITGDRVTLDAAGKVTRVTPAKGREQTTFRIQQARGHTYVVPQDASALIASGKADRRLFDVTELTSLHYDDARRSDLPVIVQYAKGKSLAGSTFSASGAQVRRDLPSINGDALRAPKARGAALWQTLTGSGAQTRSLAATSSAKVARIWLDGKVKASLDKSVPQIGAPTAWAAGYDGKGVKVAVLDTGIDATHPDLKDRIDAEKNFSGSGAADDVVDRAGHGTHVASTIAGSGAKSGGKYKGVAPGARLLVGKVLGDDGMGDDSGIIAGMQWAVAQGAKVVNLSLGGEDTPGTDPIEQAVDDLSAASGTLFVIAAGNEGPQAGTVGSPGSAAAALTVGAVDRQDAIADFSSRGPTADGALKPDITAPGVGIVAAKAAKGYMGDPAADGYVSMSGTSMATPHVAGAAAILAEEHPDWTGRQIKAALTASAKPTAGASSYAQGTGRVDLTKAIKQQVTSGPTAVSFGVQQWPHADDKPVTKQVTYHNAGDRPVTLDLGVDAVGPDGKPAPDGMFTVSQHRLTVPAGGEATATVTADTRAGTADGEFGGSLTATSADGATSVRTALGVTREIESYNLTVKYVGLDGKPATSADSTVYGWDAEVFNDFAAGSDGTATVRLPKGRYTLDGRIRDDADSTADAVLFQPKVALTKDTTLVMDARKTKPVRISVPDAAAKNTEAVANLGVHLDGKSYLSSYLPDDFGTIRFGQLGAKVPASEAYVQYSGTWTHKAVNYRLAWNRTGDLSGFTAKVRQNQLAKVKVQVGPLAKGDTYSVIAAPLQPGSGDWFDFTPTEGRLPLTGTDYVLPNGIKWHYAASEYGLAGADGDPVWRADQSAAPRAFTAGQDHIVRFNTAVLGPALPSGTLTPGDTRPGAARLGDTFQAYLPLFSDGAGNVGDSAYTKARSSLYADGTKIFATATPLEGDTYTLPAGAATYRLSTDVSRSSAVFPTSTRVAAEWTFRSAHVTGSTEKQLPLSVVRFTPNLSLSGTTKAGTTFAVPFTVQGAGKAGHLRGLAFQVSYDNGKTWKKAPVDPNGKQLDLRHPAKPGTVSLRATLTDANGNTLKQTVWQAYRTVK